MRSALTKSSGDYNASAHLKILKLGLVAQLAAMPRASA
jgi:hypothetical protein